MKENRIKGMNLGFRVVGANPTSPFITSFKIMVYNGVQRIETAREWHTGEQDRGLFPVSRTFRI